AGRLVERRRDPVVPHLVQNPVNRGTELISNATPGVTDPVTNRAHLLQQPIEGALEPVNDVRLHPVINRPETVLQARPDGLNTRHLVRKVRPHTLNASLKLVEHPRLDVVPTGTQTVTQRIPRRAHTIPQVAEPS